MIRQYANLDEMYRATLCEVYHEFEFINSPRGNREREIIGYSAKIKDSTDRFCMNPIRKQNIIFNYAEALWYLSGSNDLSFIEYYAPSMKKYSSDGMTLPGTGYGPKLLHFGDNNLNQIRRAIDIFDHDDRDSKRVFLQIFDANEDLYRRNIDVSCTLGLQLLIRDNRLHAVAFMRANDAYVGFLSDIFSFTFLQEYIASVLGCDVGSYTHTVGSLHVYDENVRRVEQVIRPTTESITTERPPRMPSGCTPELIEHILCLEGEIRRDRLLFTDLEKLDLHPYWRAILGLFCLYRQIRRGETLNVEKAAALPPFYRDFLRNRWSDR